ncbi:psbP 1, chloroplastic [Olea europaea subsp. europaea]|uniref:PsbP 1, chloroplastic n=1 Tax=Olea europaea subsp. europaea TaxID=158383 RepID=A0A8S0PN04_OLEEU|nr:psbP 1, chloroplastic [Olea europaea subsp. europaea]
MNCAGGYSERCSGKDRARPTALFPVDTWQEARFSSPSLGKALIRRPCSVLPKDMVSLHNSPSIHQTLLRNVSTKVGLCRHGHHQRNIVFFVRSDQVPTASTSPCQDTLGRRQVLALGVTISPGLLLPHQTSMSFAAETKQGFLSVTDKKDGYTFLYPFGWQEVVVEGEDKVFKDVIEPLESVSVNLIPTSKQDIRDFGSPQEVAQTLIRKVLASPSQKTKLIQASEHDVNGKAYYVIEFIAQAPNYSRHALSAICVGNGKFYTLTTGANERRWEKMKDRLKTVVDSFQIFNV